MKLNYVPILTGVMVHFIEHLAYKRYGPESEQYPHSLPNLLKIVERIHNCCHHLEDEIRKKIKEAEE